MELRQAGTSYPFTKDVMPMSKIELSQTDKEKLKNNLKIGIYKELYAKNLLIDIEFRILAEKQRTNPNGHAILQ